MAIVLCAMLGYGVFAVLIALGLYLADAWPWYEEWLEFRYPLWIW